MARATGKTKTTTKTTSKPPTTTLTTPVMPSDSSPNPAATPSSALSQETSTPAQVNSKKQSSAAKLKTKISSRAPADPNDAAALLARLAEQEGKCFFSGKLLADHNFCLAEIDRLRKATQSMAQDTKLTEINCPHGPITNLQKAMGLKNDRALYMNCRVSFLFYHLS